MTFLSPSLDAPQKHVLGLVGASRDIRRTPVVGMDFLHQRAMRTNHVVARRSFPKAEDLIRLFFGQARPEPAVSAATPRIALRLTCLTPAGKPAIQIRL